MKKDNGKQFVVALPGRGYQGVRYAFLHHGLWKQADVRCIDPWEHRVYDNGRRGGSSEACRSLDV